MKQQSTLKRASTCVGTGLHSGKKVRLELLPAPADSGIVFRRVDRGGVEIPARMEYLSHINHATCLARGDVRVETVEHLLAALAALGVDNAVIELDAPEVPIMDGSAAPFVYLIHEAGIRRLHEPRSFIRVKRPVVVEQAGERGGKRAALYPSDRFRVSYTIGFDHPLIRHQERTLDVDETTFQDEIAPARTFGFLKDVEQLRLAGLALGGSLENAVVIGETGVLNNPLRFADEFVRHKILDAVGDLALLGKPLLGHLVAVRAGHELHAELMRHLSASEGCWEHTTEEEPLEEVALAGARAPSTVS